MAIFGNLRETSGHLRKSSEDFGSGISGGENLNIGDFWLKRLNGETYNYRP